MGLTVLNFFSHTQNAAAYRRLALLGTASVALSIASGWTTWDGMANFTDNPVLSFLITFGIQGVMLVAAWLIGESLIHKGPEIARSQRGGTVRLSAMAIWILGILVGLSLWFVAASTGSLPRLTSLASAWSSEMIVALVLIVLGGAFLLLTSPGSNSRQPASLHAPALLTSVKHLPLWIMFMTCLTASVFFSFDSLFDTIFSSDDRRRASHTRMQSEVARVLTGTANEARDHQKAAISDLFSSPAWVAYSHGIDSLITAASEATVTLRDETDAGKRRKHDEMAAQRAAISAAESKLTALNTQHSGLQDDMAAMKPAVEEAQALVESRGKELGALNNELRIKQAEAEAELAGVGATQIAGAGPRFRGIKQEETKLQIEAKLLARHLADAKAELARLMASQELLLEKAARNRDETAATANEITSAKTRLATLASASSLSADLLADIAEQTAALNSAKVSFVSNPAGPAFQDLQRDCGALLTTLKSATHPTRMPEVTCAADNVSEFADKVFVANSTLKSFQSECGDPSKLEGLDTNELLQVGVSCLRAVGMQSATMASFQSDLRQASLRRDDQAHRFIVTWNAFFDRNPLAFVALFIAVAMDGLIFMSGLFGARVRSEMLPTPEEAARGDPRHADVLLHNALQPEAPERSRLLIESIDFSEKRGDIVGHIDLGKVPASQSSALRPVLNAATVLGLARPTGNGRFEITRDLIGRVSQRIAQERDAEPAAVTALDAEDLLRLSMGRQANDIARLLLQIAKPLPKGEEFSHEIDASRLAPAVRDRLVTVLNAGVAAGYVATAPAVADLYVLNPAFFLTVTRIIAEQEPQAPRPHVALSEVAHAPQLPPPIVEARALEGAPQTSASEMKSPAPRAEPQRPSLPERPAPSRPSAPTSPPLGGDADKASAGEVTKAPIQRAQSAPTLLAFPIELTPRRRSRIHHDARPQQQQDPGARRDAPLPPVMLAGLSRATGLTRPELAQLVDPQASEQFKAALSAAKTLRAGDPTLDRALHQLERTLWTKIQNAIPSRSVVSIHAEPATRLIADGFPRIALRCCELKGIRGWCDNLVMEQELLAAAEGVSQDDVKTLARIAQHLPALMAVDDIYQTSWKEMICRIKRLCDTPNSNAALGEIMP